MSGYVAYCWASGEIEIGTAVPAGALPILRDTSRRRLQKEIEVTARHAYDGKTLLVPGIPEAANQKDGVEALSRYVDWLTNIRPARRAGRGAA